MYKIFREGGVVEPPKRAQIDTLNDGDILSFTNGLSRVELSLQGHRLSIKALLGKPVEVKIDPRSNRAAMVEQKLGGRGRARIVTTLRRNVIIKSQDGEHKLVLMRDTPLVKK